MPLVRHAYHHALASPQAVMWTARSPRLFHRVASGCENTLDRWDAIATQYAKVRPSPPARPGHHGSPQLIALLHHIGQHGVHVHITASSAVSARCPPRRSAARLHEQPQTLVLIGHHIGEHLICRLFWMLDRSLPVRWWAMVLMGVFSRVRLFTRSF